MTTETLPAGPDSEAIARTIRETWPDTDIVEVGGAAFFSLDPERHWPNFATIVTTDDFDQASNLSRPGVFRLDIGVGRETFRRLVGTVVEPEFTALDRLLPHPVYARQYWISILNPSDVTYRQIVLALLAEAHDRLAAQSARHGRHGTSNPSVG